MNSRGSGAFWQWKDHTPNLIGALHTTSDGQIVMNGQNITRMSRSQRFQYRRETVSFIFQSFNLFPGLTALENVQFGLEFF